jgi:hypothetical protein
MNKAIGIARQSKGDDASKSIEAQVARIRDYSKSEGFTLVNVLEERDVSGGTPLAKRDGLRSAVRRSSAARRTSSLSLTSTGSSALSKYKRRS